jgi:hypothetical protein
MCKFPHEYKSAFLSISVIPSWRMHLRTLLHLSLPTRRDSDHDKDANVAAQQNKGLEVVSPKGLFALQCIEPSYGTMASIAEAQTCVPPAAASVVH